LAIAEFASALLIIPKILAVNAARDASDLIAKLRAHHAASQSAATTDSKKRSYKNYGLDLLNGKLVDEIKEGVLEPSMSKIKSLKAALEACIAILRIDTMIRIDPEQKPEQDEHGH